MFQFYWQETEASKAPPKRFDSYREYLNRGGPKAPGTKTIPEVSKENYVISYLFPSLLSPSLFSPSLSPSPLSLSFSPLSLSLSPLSLIFLLSFPPPSLSFPQGATNCLHGLTFVFTGVGESIERDEAAELVKKYGARVTTSLSKKTNYLVVGEGAGVSKLAQVSCSQLTSSQLTRTCFLKEPMHSL